MKNIYFNFALYGGDNFVIPFTKETYNRTASGRSWKKAPEAVERETISTEFYNNYVSSIPFFAAFPGASCRAAWGYTYAGYIPVRVTSISPDQSTKIVARFSFSFRNK